MFQWRTSSRHFAMGPSGDMSQGQGGHVAAGRHLAGRRTSRSRGTRVRGHIFQGGHPSEVTLSKVDIFHPATFFSGGHHSGVTSSCGKHLSGEHGGDRGTYMWGGGLYGCILYRV